MPSYDDGSNRYRRAVLFLCAVCAGLAWLMGKL